MNNYYVYRYIRLDTNTPFYVGKGKKNRAYELKWGRNKYFKHIINSIPYELEFIMEDLTEEQAFVKEKEFVKLYKKNGYCEANLTDGGEGASGLIVSVETKLKLSIQRIGKLNPFFGKKHNENSKEKMAKASTDKHHTKETIKKLSDSLKGKPSPLKGRPQSKEHREKRSLATKGRIHTLEHSAKISAGKKGKAIPRLYKKVQCIETGEIFESLNAAAKFLNVTSGTLSENIKFNMKNRKTGLRFKFI